MIAREGAAAVLLAVTGAAIALYAGWQTVGYCLAAAAVLLVLAFLDLPRRLPSAPLDVVSAVDGRVIDIDRGQHRWFEGESLRIRVRVRWPGVKVIRAPTEGQVQEVLGGHRDGDADGSPDDYAVHLQTDEGDDVVYVVRSEWPLSRFRSYAAIGERVGHGRRCGFVYFATCVELLLPADCECAATEGQRVRGGISTLARLQDSGAD